MNTYLYNTKVIEKMKKKKNHLPVGLVREIIKEKQKQCEFRSKKKKIDGNQNN